MPDAFEPSDCGIGKDLLFRAFGAGGGSGGTGKPGGTGGGVGSSGSGSSCGGGVGISWGGTCGSWPGAGGGVAGSWAVSGANLNPVIFKISLPEISLPLKPGAGAPGSGVHGHSCRQGP